jgi:hypothetical protein
MNSKMLEEGFGCLKAPDISSSKKLDKGIKDKDVAS